MLIDEDNKPKRILGRVEWPIAFLFSAIPTLVLVALVKNTGLL